MILVRMCTDAKDWVEAGSALGFPADKSRNWTRYAFSAKWQIKDALVARAQQLDGRIDHQPPGTRWATRNTVSGHGAAALRLAQAPKCRYKGGAWCRCETAA